MVDAFTRYEQVLLDPARTRYTILESGLIPGSESIHREVDKIARNLHSLSEKIFTGFEVFGDRVASARAWRSPVEVRRGATSTTIIINDLMLKRSKNGKFLPDITLIRFEDGTGICLSVMPGYVGSVKVERGSVLTVNYTPNRKSSRFREYRYVASEIEERRAFVAVAARNGAFRLSSGETLRVASYLRSLKSIDPTLGLYAAYAYAQTGDTKGVQSIFSHMRREPEPVPFDVAMLALQHDLNASLDYSPWMPMLTQGWMLLGRFEAHMPKPVRAAQKYLLPSLWTTFAPEGMSILESVFRRPQ